MRRAMETLRSTKRFGCDLHLREFFEDFRQKFDAIAAKVGISAEHYRQWLQENGQADSISSRHRYLIDMDGPEGAARSRTGQ